jgi:AraC-like DNA-binding protein
MVIAKYPKRVPKKMEVDPDRLPPVLSVAEASALLGCSRWTTVRIFQDEPGRLIRLKPETMHKRSRRKLTIPRAVFLRVKTRLER